MAGLSLCCCRSPVTHRRRSRCAHARASHALTGGVGGHCGDGVHQTGAATAGRTERHEFRRNGERWSLGGLSEQSPAPDQEPQINLNNNIRWLLANSTGFEPVASAFGGQWSLFLNVLGRSNRKIKLLFFQEVSVYYSSQMFPSVLTGGGRSVVSLKEVLRWSTTRAVSGLPFGYEPEALHASAFRFRSGL